MPTEMTHFYISQGSSSQNLRACSVNSKCYPFLEHLRNSFFPDHFAFPIYSVFWHPAIKRLRLIVPQMSLWGYCQECFLYNTLSSSGRPKGGILCGLHHQGKLSSAFLLTTSLLLTWLSPITYNLFFVTVYSTMSLFGLLWRRESHFGTVNCNSTRYYGLRVIVS